MSKKPANDSINFKKGDAVVYPAHGVGKIEGIEAYKIGDVEVSLYSIAFDKDRMRLKIPVQKAEESGLRALCSTSRMDDALTTLQGKAKAKRAMWSRRAQEYETKILSGDPVLIAEVLKDLYKKEDFDDSSFSEKQIYSSALDRLARELAAMQKLDKETATKKLEEILSEAA